MNKPLKRAADLIIMTSIGVLLLGLVALVSFYTPVFSTVGLWVLNHLPVPKVNHQPRSVLKPSDANDTHTQNAKAISLGLSFNHEPTAYVVLGGGLTEADTYNEPDTESDKSSEQNNRRQIKSSISASYQVNNEAPSQASTTSKPSLRTPAMNNIVLNKYSLMRMKTVMQHYNNKPLPIVLTGVDAPWMQDWLVNYGIENIVTENASMNTCENARFTAKRLKLQDVYLITDAYHMTRARRQFALNGIHTSPVPAALPMHKGWLSPTNNAQHSRRTIYELAAYTRDVFFPQKNCRSANEVSFETLLRSRKPENVKTF